MVGGKQAQHAIQWLCVHGPAALAGVWLRAEEISAALLTCGKTAFVFIPAV